ncbi:MULTISPECIES: hypothetical protein [Streptomyces]|uniref:Uncharacterized protein n=2 Tax=Streptomyces TaxID=1883 RepID=A0ABV9JAI7_9ACTN
MSNYGWDGGCWLVLDRACELVSGFHHPTEASAHAVALPVGFFVWWVQCTEHIPDCHRKTAEGEQPR